jgi:hypothetical protein
LPCWRRWPAPEGFFIGQTVRRAPLRRGAYRAILPAQENNMNAIQSRRRFLGVLSAGAASAIAPAAVAGALAPAAETLLSAPATLAAAVPAVAPPEEPFDWSKYPDAKLFKLVNEYLAADDERRRLEEVIDRGEKVQAAKHPMPDVLRVLPEDAELELPDHNGVYDGLFFDRSSRETYEDAMWIEALRRLQWKRLVEVHYPDAESTVRHGYFDPSPAARARADEIVTAYDEWWPKLHRRTGREIKPRLPRGFSAVEKQERRLSRLLSRLEAKINKTRARTFPELLAKAKIASVAAPDMDDWIDADPVIGSVMHDMLAIGDWMGWPACHLNGKAFPSRGRA